MKRALLGAVLLSLAASTAFAGETLERFRRDKDFDKQGRFYHILWVNPAAADTNAVAPNIMLDSCAATTHTFTAAEIAALGTSNTVARTVSVNIFSMTNTANDIAAAVLIVSGTNLLDESIDETFTITNNTENSQQGTEAFKTITSFTCTAMDDDSVGVSIGVGTKLGLHHTLAFPTMIMAWNGTSADASAAITADNDEIEKNVIDYNTDPTGTSDHTVLYWIPPFNLTTSPGGRGQTTPNRY